ncbi:helix-turn-helix domain-containing protein [Magnetospirillum sp. UT-4]|uniref:helix-turn-helix domain-containing protein n=1 Tax=Magnetospirillum sp. UT-4 TaxID=2681467 RepID=UPI0013827D9D|nr:helix-turn-helix transcriptional regulator [Magnetospirillum sp. UT-4]CAA7625729.1 Uncharacterized HTH-type transcriptional regulator Smed_0045 [Magnetospirillum sp. UT-4]
MARKTGSRGRLPNGAPNPIDSHVGGRVRLRRTLLGMTQERLAALLGLTFQQIQKYERGANRIGASRLFDLARVLDVPVGYFFEGLAEEAMALSPGLLAKMAPADATFPDQGKDAALKRETLELVRNYYRIGDPRLRKQIMDLALALSDPAEAKSA